MLPNLNGSVSVKVVLIFRETGSEYSCKWCYTSGIYIKRIMCCIAIVNYIYYIITRNMYTGNCNIIYYYKLSEIVIDINCMIVYNYTRII